MLEVVGSIPIGSTIRQGFQTTVQIFFRFWIVLREGLRLGPAKSFTLANTIFNDS